MSILLSTLLSIPAIGALCLVIIPALQLWLVRQFALFTVAACFGFSLWILYQFDPAQSALQFAEFYPLNPKLGSVYAVGVDGISMPMLLLATFLTLVTMLVSLKNMRNLKEYCICVLLLELGVMGVFVAQDWALFYIFWEMTLIPLFFLIDRWGGKRRHEASLNFVLFTMGGSVFMLLSLLAISQYDFENQGSLMVEMGQVAQSMPFSEQVMVLLGFLIGFGVKMPIFPLHGWLRLAHVEAPTPISILLSGILLKMGAYGLLRTIVMVPEAVLFLQPVLIALALFSIVYGALLAIRQTDFKVMVAYSSLSHMGVVLLGIACLSLASIRGAVLQMVSHGLVAAALFLLAGFLYERFRSREIDDYAGVFCANPRLTGLATIIFFMAMGFPGSLGFVAELEILLSGLSRWSGWMVIFAIGLLVGVAYVLQSMVILRSSNPNPAVLGIRDLSRQECLLLMGLIMANFMLGMFPEQLIQLSAPTLSHLVGFFNEAEFG